MDFGVTIQHPYGYPLSYNK
jgi:hypothetical protein